MKFYYTRILIIYSVGCPLKFTLASDWRDLLEICCLWITIKDDVVVAEISDCVRPRRRCWENTRSPPKIHSNHAWHVFFFFNILSLKIWMAVVVGNILLLLEIKYGSWFCSGSYTPISSRDYFLRCLHHFEIYVHFLEITHNSPLSSYS